ncbi:MAG: hypothetical protein WA510_26215, partial [Acidobacteriaceae bacterium]
MLKAQLPLSDDDYVMRWRGAAFTHRYAYSGLVRRPYRLFLLPVSWLPLQVGRVSFAAQSTPLLQGTGQQQSGIVGAVVICLAVLLVGAVVFATIADRRRRQAKAASLELTNALSECKFA